MSTFDSLDNTFDIVPSGEAKPIRKSKPLIVSDKGEDKEKDYQYARAQLYDIVEKMQETLDGAMEVAQQSDHPRAYEVVFNGAKNAADVVDKIQDLHKKMAEVEKEETKVQTTNTQNNIYMAGTTAELMKLIKEGTDK